MEKVAKDRSFVRLVLNALITWGKNETVHNKPASNPIMKSIVSILISPKSPRL